MARMNWSKVGQAKPCSDLTKAWLGRLWFCSFELQSWRVCVMGSKRPLFEETWLPKCRCQCRLMATRWSHCFGKIIDCRRKALSTIDSPLYQRHVRHSALERSQDAHWRGRAFEDRTHARLAAKVDLQIFDVEASWTCSDTSCSHSLSRNTADVSWVSDSSSGISFVEVKHAQHVE